MLIQPDAGDQLTNLLRMILDWFDTGAATSRDDILRKLLVSLLPIKRNADYKRFCQRITTDGFGLGLVGGYSAIWTLPYPLLLDGDKQDRFIVRLNDDFTGLNSQTFTIHGRMVNKIDIGVVAR